MAAPNTVVALERRAEVTSWYFDKDLSTLLTPASQAYINARNFFTSCLVLPEDRPSVDQWLSTITTMSDFQATIIALQSSIDSKSLSKSSKSRQWLASCAQRVAFYGSIMDTLVQHHPEYVSLAWGAFKFLFTAVLNYESLLAAIAKTFSRIADVLPRADLHLRLYTTGRMLADVAQIYASILHFVLRATEWLLKNRVQRSLSAIIKPFEISFKDIVDEIGTCSRRVDEHANAAMKAELRDLHIEMMHMKESTNAALTQIRSDIYFQSQQFIQHQRSQALSILSSSADVDPVATLEFNHSFLRRRQAHVFSYQRRRGYLWPDILTQSLQTLAAADKSKVLLLKAPQSIAPARDAAVDIIDLVREAKVPIFWVMTSDSDDVEIQVADVFRRLLTQSLSDNANAFRGDGPFPLTPEHVRQAHTDPAMWPSLLAKAISNLAPQIFIVIETSALQQGGTRPAILDLIAQLEKLCGATAQTKVKVIVADRYHLQGLQEPGLSPNISLVSVYPHRDFRRARPGREHFKSSHMEHRVVQRDRIVFTITTATEEPKEEEDEWV
ncbi:hypothetical protein GP486_000651 [Trichoglossum hirsutum]|uniref:DUF7708 domain-containing protein n=1 Tax=Trichoglossum hirsutum TaxID=265104 RepID=A0A9P8LIM9_9PEZI|nr:hypothetical protein GP486_000651 [Trichoglossum hirsutum]